MSAPQHPDGATVADAQSDGDRPIDIVIVGAGFGREIHAWVSDCFPPATHRVVGYLGEETGAVEHAGRSYPILGNPVTYQPQPGQRFLLAVGHVPSRRKVVESLVSRGAEFLTLVHPSAVIAETAEIGVGCVIYPQAVVANVARLADYSLLNNFASVGHDARVGRFVNLCPYATLCGGSAVDDDCFLASHVTVGPGITIGAGSVISANTAALRNAPPKSMIVGVPGKIGPRLE